MRFYYKDLQPAKDRVIAFLKEADWDVKTTKEVRDANMLALQELCESLHVPLDKMMALMKSQIMSGNISGAMKVVNGTPSRKFNGWGRLITAPITIPIIIISTIMYAPIALYNWTMRNL